MSATISEFRLAGLAFVLFAALAVVHTWPLASAPATLSRNDNADTLLNSWAIAWVAHALTTDPVHVLDGNVFYPERYTLAFSEPLLLPGALSIPVRAAGASAVLNYNLSLLLGFVLTAWAAQWVTWRWTGDFAASLVGGSLLAFNAHVLTRFGHLQAIHAYGLPLLVYALDQVLRPDGRRVRDGVLLAFAGASLIWTSGYLTMFGIVGGLVVVAMRARDLGRGSTPALIRSVAAAMLLGAVLTLPVVTGYVAMRRAHGFERSIDSVAAMSANPAAYLYTAGRLHQTLWAGEAAARWQPRDALFPGIIGLLLAVIGAWRSRGPVRRFGVGLVVAGVVLSLGPQTPLYDVFYASVPFASGVRAASRFGVLALLGIALLAPFALVRRGSGRPAAVLLSVVALIGVNAEAFRGPVPFVAAQPVSSIYTRLAGLPAGPVAEMPFWWAPLDIPRNAEYMLASTVHWKPLLNGYSGFSPGSYRRLADTLWYFPFRPASFDVLRKTGVRYVVLHLDQYGSQRREALALIDDSGRLRMLDRTDDIVLYEVVR